MSKNFVVDGKELRLGDILFEKENPNYKFKVIDVSEDEITLNTIPLNEKAAFEYDRVKNYCYSYTPHDFTFVKDIFYFQS